MAFEIPTIKYSGSIQGIKLGSGKKRVDVGGEKSYAFHLFEGEMPHPPVIAMEVWDMYPEDWVAACREPFEGVLDDPGAWAKKCVEEYGADAIVVQLKSTDPNGLDAPPEKASEAVGKVLKAVDVPVIVWGTANNAKDAEVLKKIAEDFEGKNLLLGPVEEGNHKPVGAAALAYKHSVIASSPIDVNLAKQLNILLGNLGVPTERVVIDPTTGGLGYGLEYSYSVMERIRMAALVQEDDKLALPMINNVGNEVWKTKEAKLSAEEAPDLGDDRLRGVLMETISGVSFLLAGSDILILRHPESVKLIKGFIEKMRAERAPAAERVKVERERAKPVEGVKPKAKPSAKPAAATEAPKARPALEAKPRPAAAAEAKAAPAPSAKPAAAPAAAAEVAVKAELEEKAKAEAAQKAEAEAQALAAAQAAAKAQAEQEARQEAQAKAEAERRAREEKKEREVEELIELRRRRREEREKRMAEVPRGRKDKEDVEYGKGPEAGTAGPEAVYIVRALERWRLRGDGILKR